MTITQETRRKSYHEVLESLGSRQRLVYDHLAEGTGATAGELAVSMWRDDVIPTPERNAVHPRLNELVAADVVEVVGKRKCEVSGKTCAVYRAKEWSE